MEHSVFSSSTAGGLLVAGLALAALGFARAPQAGGTPPSNGGQTSTQPAITPASTTADSNNRMIAVTGVDITGASILYLVDTINYRLCIYQANGGAPSTQGIKFVGARRIDLDMQLDGLNDKSDYPYKKLRALFGEQGLLPASDAGLPGGPEVGGRNN